MLCQTALAQSTIEGKAVRILDGDTFEMLLANYSKVKIRLTDIDAPEKKQDFGNVSKQYLASLIFDKKVKVVYDKLDRNKRILGHVYIQKMYVNLKMVQQGLAWHYKKYSSEKLFSDAEILAKRSKKGLWIQPNAMPPWLFRANARNR